jgi:hypothetical protein
LFWNPKTSNIFEPAEPLFGKDVQDKFQTSALYEIDEAAKCLAFGRDTAAVFHLMRVIEDGIKAISKCLAISDPIKEADRNWGVFLRKISDAIKARSSGTPTAWRQGEDKQFFENCLASLDAVKNAWRNPTMHVENKYSREEAIHIFGAVKGFMKKLASRMDEQGMPLA